MGKIFICPKCGATYESDSETKVCADCGITAKNSGYSNEAWYALSGPERTKIKKGLMVIPVREALVSSADKKRIIVTTGDLKRDYEVLCPVYFQVSNKGVFSSTLSRLKKKYRDDLANMEANGTLSPYQSDWGFLYGEWSVGQNDFESAFYVATEELKQRARMVGADAVICMKQDIDLDTNSFSFFYLQMYGTAVRFTDTDKEE